MVGDAIIEFGMAYNLAIANTYFQRKENLIISKCWKWI